MLNLTPAQEAGLLKKYDSFLGYVVAQYYGNVPLPFSGCWDDMMQEARCVFLRHIRRIEDLSRVKKCELDIKHALCLYRESMSIVRIPHYTYGKHRRAFAREVFDALDLEGVVLPSHEDDSLTNALIARFRESLSDAERAIFEMRLAGHTNREIMRALSISSDQAMSRRLAKIKGKFKAFIADP